MVLIGSAAIKHWFSDFPRESKDIDYAVEIENVPYKKGYEFLYNPVIATWTGDFYPTIATPNMLYTLKMSHVVGWKLNNNSWDKHVWDIQWLKDKGCQLIPSLFDELYNFWPTIHGTNKRSDLVMSSEDFFHNAITCEYDHDWLHTLLQNPPTYSKVLKDGAEVEVDQYKFNNLLFEDKCNLVYEEVELMSWERWPELDYRYAYSRMLKKFILNHAPLWEAIFIVENYKLLHMPRRNHFKLLNDKIQEYGNKAIKRAIEESTDS